MKIINLHFHYMLIALLLSGCATVASTGAPPPPVADVQASVEAAVDLQLAPILLQFKTASGRGLASQSSPGKVSVYLAERPTFQIPGPSFGFTVGQELTPDEIERLRHYLQDQREQLDARGEIGFDLRFVSQAANDNKHFIRFEQRMRHGVRKPFYIPIIGATIVAQIVDGHLVKLNSHLETPPPLTESLKNAGLKLAFTDSELAVLITQIKLAPESRARLTKFIDQIARRVGLMFDFDALLNHELREQRDLLTLFFSSIGPLETARLLLDLAKHQQLALIRHGRSGQEQWMFQVSEFFLLPVQFDIDLPGEDGQPLRIKNLRRMHENLTIEGILSPHFPSAPDVPDGGDAPRAVARMKGVVSYFRDKFGWTSYAGKQSQQALTIHTGLQSLDYAENAAWVGKLQTFLVGAGGPSLTNLGDSTSVLAHEYMHAILQFSSGLQYTSETGAVNEHLADIEGASADATVNNGGTFLYTVGEDVLTPAVRQQKEKLLRLILMRYHYTPSDVSAFDLKHASLRHLYSPALSFATQFDQMSDLRQAYPADCQPSVDNDNCGIHEASGVPNKAAALIIGKLGFEKTRALFFNTAAYRLTETTTFTDYLVQLHDECLDEPALANSCDVILASFASVGVQHPDHPLPPSQTPVSKSPEENAHPTAASPSATTASLRASTPSLTLCGWVDRREPTDTVIIDGKFDAHIFKHGYELTTKGDLSALAHLNCACVTGRVTNLNDVDSKSTLVSAFTNVDEIVDRKDACVNQSELAHLRPSTGKRVLQLPALVSPVKHCGWVRLSPTAQNVTIVENQEAVTILSDDPAAMSPALRAAQCACVEGAVEQISSTTGVADKHFMHLQPGAISIRLPKECSGISWR